MFLCAEPLHALQLLALVGDIARRTFVVHHVERIARLRGAVETQHQHRRRRRRLGDARTALVEHRLHTARIGTRKHHVAHAERTVLHQYRRHITAPLVKR